MVCDLRYDVREFLDIVTGADLDLSEALQICKLDFDTPVTEELRFHNF